MIQRSKQFDKAAFTPNEPPAGGKGFTLIELLVVIAVISLLVSILLPSLHQARILANQTVCTSHLHQILLAFGLYHNDFNDFYPDYRKELEDGTILLWFKEMEKAGYFPNREILWCPGNQRGETKEQKASRYKWAGIDHGYNMLMTLVYVTSDKCVADPAHAGDILDIANTIIVLDTRQRTPADELDPMTSWGKYSCYPWYYTSIDHGAGIAVARHGDRCGVGWADGHTSVVEQPDPDDESSLYWPEALTSKHNDQNFWDRK